MKFKAGDRVMLDPNRKVWDYIEPSILSALKGDDGKRVWVVREDLRPYDKYSYGLICVRTGERCRWRFNDEELVSVDESQAQAQTDQAIIAELKARVQGLLEANNALVEREREAKRRAEIAEQAVRVVSNEIFEMGRRLMAVEDASSKLREQAGNALILESDLKQTQANLEQARKEFEELESMAIVPPSNGSVFWISEEGNPFLYHEDGWHPATMMLDRLNVKLIRL